MGRLPQPGIRRRMAILIRDRSEVDGFPPTARELADAMGLASPATVQWHIDRMRRDGWLRPAPVGRVLARTVVLTPLGLSEATKGEQE